MSFAKGIKTFCFHIYMHFRIVKIKGSRIIGHSITIKNNCWELYQDAEMQIILQMQSIYTTTQQ